VNQVKAVLVVVIVQTPEAIVVVVVEVEVVVVVRRRQVTNPVVAVIAAMVVNAKLMIKASVFGIRVPAARAAVAVAAAGRPWFVANPVPILPNANPRPAAAPLFAVILFVKPLIVLRDKQFRVPTAPVVSTPGCAVRPVA
jgi:hypothetical protein